MNEGVNALTKSMKPAPCPCKDLVELRERIAELENKLENMELVFSNLVPVPPKGFLFGIFKRRKKHD